MTVWCLLVTAVTVWLFQGHRPVNKLITSTNARDGTIKDDVPINSSQLWTFDSERLRCVRSVNERLSEG